MKKYLVFTFIFLTTRALLACSAAGNGSLDIDAGQVALDQTSKPNLDENKVVQSLVASPDQDIQPQAKQGVNLVENIVNEILVKFKSQGWTDTEILSLFVLVKNLQDKAKLTDKQVVQRFIAVSGKGVVHTAQKKQQQTRAAVFSGLIIGVAIMAFILWALYRYMSKELKEAKTEKKAAEDRTNELSSIIESKNGGLKDAIIGAIKTQISADVKGGGKNFLTQINDARAEVAIGRNDDLKALVDFSENAIKEGILIIDATKQALTAKKIKDGVLPAVNVKS